MVRCQSKIVLCPLILDHIEEISHDDQSRKFVNFELQLIF